MSDDQLSSEIGDDMSGQASMLANVLLLTEKMLSAAHNGDWDSISLFEEQRREALRLCFSSSILPGQEELYSQALAAMLHMNEEMIGLVEVARDNVAIKRTDQKYVLRSLGHYLDVEKGH